MRNLWHVLLSLGLLLGSAVVVTTIFRPSPRASSTPTGIASTEQRIQTLESRIRRSPKNVELRLELAQVLLQKVRETADVALYARVEEVLNDAEQLAPGRADIIATRSAIAFGRHQFREAKRLAEEAIQRNQHAAAHYGLLGDAALELGQYIEAVEAFQRMVDLRPNLSAYHRIAYARELHGDLEGAEEAIRDAISAGSLYPENLAWSYVLLGNLALRRDPDAAARAYERALAVVPDHPPALEGRGRVAVAQGDLRGALPWFERALARLPVAQHAIDLGDTYVRLGEKERAETYYTLAQLAFEKSQASGVNTDLEIAFFLADHDRDLGTALQKAEAAHRDRPSIQAADVLAWALYKDGQHERAAHVIKEALRLGEHDPLIVFHAAVIAEATGNRAEARWLFERTRQLAKHIAILYDPVVEERLRLMPP
ncbi:MAG: hypothetical protein G01um101438_599 [Parcubacteria group bacterium Gr01-1014_38]|nr:MAG: hypothetical protein G01um101438_599 [Parcubacteria group bacterium Gr01-1014_38]